MTARRRRTILHFVLLFLIIAAGGAIRFWHLDRPCLWGDEANVYWRSIGKYSDMLNEIRDQGFGPLHYQLYWLLLRKNVQPSPWRMRLPPAVAGTLMIAGMYLLGRQLLQRGTALLAAGITAFSGFLIFYSRDAKMYAETWLFLTLSAAGLMWWLRTGRLTAWLAWVAAGCIGCGIHASALALVALSPVLLLTCSYVHWRRALAWLAGVILILAGPVGYYTTFNRWNTNVGEEGWRRSGIEWVEAFNAGRDGLDLVRCTATSYLMGWTWPRKEDVHDVQPVLLEMPAAAATLLAAIGLVCLVPWPLSQRPDRTIDPPPQPQWRVFLWLGLWIGLPGYFFYCHSMNGFASPADWGDWLLHRPALAALRAHHWLDWLLGILLLAGVVAMLWRFPQSRPALRRGVQWMLAAAALLIGCQCIYHACVNAAMHAEFIGRPWQSIWMPRYLGFIWPAVALAAAALLMRLPTRPIRAAAILVLLAVNLAFGLARIFGDSEPPVDRMAADAYVAVPSDSVVRTYFNIEHGDGRPGWGTIFTMSGRYYLQVYAQLRDMNPRRFMMLPNELPIRSNTREETIVSQVKSDRTLRRLVVWDDIDFKIAAATDRLGPKLPGWRLVHDDWYRVRDFWTWENLIQYRRREYVRLSTPRRGTDPASKTPNPR